MTDKSNEEAIIRYQELVELEQSYFQSTLTDKDLRQAENLCRYYENRNLHHYTKALLLLGEAFLKSGDYPSALKVLLEAQDNAEYQEQRKKRIEQMEASELYQRLTNPVKGKIVKMKNEDWKALGQLLDRTYPGFTYNLLSRYALSDSEMKISYLVKLEKLSNNQIADIMLKTPSAITKSRRRMYKKLTNREGSGDDFNDLIMRL